jgi:O-antigen ligase
LINRLLLFVLFLILVLEPTRLVPLALLPGLSYKNLLIYLLVIFLGIRAALSPTGLRLTDVDVHLAFLALIIYAFLSWAVWGAFDATYPSWRAFIGMKSQIVDYYLLLLIFRYGLDSLADTVWMLRAIVGTVLLVSAAVLVDYAFGFNIFGIHHGRVEGFIGEANQFGALLTFFLPVAFATTLSFARRARWLWWLLVAVSALLLIATGSRGSYLGVIAGSFLAAWYLRRHVDFLAVIKIGGVGLAIVSLLVIVAIFAFQMDFIVERVTGSVDDTTGAGRVQIWSAAFRVMLEWPLSFLVGYGWFSYGSSGIWKAMHSEYFRTLYELGVVGLLAFLALIAVLLGRTRASLERLMPELRTVEIAYVFGLVSLLVAVAFVDIPSTWPFVWITTGLMLGIQAHSRQPAPAAGGLVDEDPQPPPADDGPRTPPGRRGGPAWVNSTRPS